MEPARWAAILLADPTTVSKCAPFSGSIGHVQASQARRCAPLNRQQRGTGRHWRPALRANGLERAKPMICYALFKQSPKHGRSLDGM
jgi:hypothetical protein